MADAALKAELTAQLARSRRLFSRNLSRLREDLDVPAHVKRNFTNHSTAWIGGAALLGWVLSRLPGRTKELPHADDAASKPAHKKRAALIPGVARLLFMAARPALTAFATKKIADIASNRR
ncbi:MAG: hypothetical protein WCH43_05775 [Verrucomicrobiota bacterium]